MLFKPDHERSERVIFPLWDRAKVSGSSCCEYVLSKALDYCAWAPKGRFLIRMGFVIQKMANWRSVPCSGAIEMGWFVSGEIGWLVIVN